MMVKGQIKNCSVADETEGDVYAEDIEDEIRDHNVSLVRIANE